MNTMILKTSAITLGIFGLVSLFMTGSITFDLFGIRAKEGNYIPFIVAVNFICSILYLLASYGFFIKSRLAPFCLLIATIILISAYIALIFYIYSGGVCETKTVEVMLFRIAVTILFTGIAWYYITRTRLLNAPLTK